MYSRIKTLVLQGTVLAAVGFLSSLTAAQAALVISTGATTNVTCEHRVCTATGSNAVLSVHKVHNMLAGGNLKVVSGSAAGDIDVQAALTWVSANTLTLDAYHSITIEEPVSGAGHGGLTLTTNDGGTGGELFFNGKGNVTFLGLSNALTIDGNVYTLVNTVATLASDIAGNPSGFYALASSYNAGVDGTYTSVPIPTTFTGTFNGLGNTISKLSIADPTIRNVALFAELSGTVRSVAILQAQIKATNTSNADQVGILAGEEDIGGIITGVSTSGTVNGKEASDTGGLVGGVDGSISNSHSSASVNGGATAGGLAGAGIGTVSNCYATGTVKASVAGGLVGDLGNFDTSKIIDSFATGDAISDNPSDVLFYAGGLVGSSRGSIVNSYATGNATDTKIPGIGNAAAGDLVGQNEGTISTSYSTGVPSRSNGRIPAYIGGFVGDDTSSSGSLSDNYWDKTTSGTTNGIGNVNGHPGVTGLTTAQFQSGLPAGFDPSIWGENGAINGGLPYLIANPPPT